ncbi:unnamed protein product, partial [Brassica napus]
RRSHSGSRFLHSFTLLHACPIQPGSVLKLDRLARVGEARLLIGGSEARLVIGESDSNNLFGGDTICFILRQDLIYRVRLGCCILRNHLCNKSCTQVNPGRLK